MGYEYKLITDIGQKRKINQDNGIGMPDLGLFMVADGMGGHKGGEIASSMAVEVIPEFIQERKQNDPEWDPRTTLIDAIATANRQIFSRSRKEIQLRGMGTTVTSLLFKDNSLYIGQVGDSRCYYFRKNAIWQLTRDHSFVQEKLRAGLISRDQVREDADRNVITRSVGFESTVSADVYEMQVQVGDVFLLCSDGLSGELTDDQINEAVQAGIFEQGEVAGTTASLVEQANAAGGEDNITVLILRITED